MSDERIYVVEEVGKVVAETERKLNMDIKYMYGHPLEIVNRLQELTKSPKHKNNRFPLIALFTDITIRSKTGFFGTCNLQMVVACLTEPGYYSEQRTEKNFKPVLHPITDEFLYQLSIHSQFTWPETPELTQTDRYYWGKKGLFGNTDNIFNDHIDCVELNDIFITVKEKYC